MEAVDDDDKSQAIQFFCERTGIDIYNEENFGVTLPPYHSKQRLYRKYCWENVWHIKSANNGEYPKLMDYVNRPNDDEMVLLALWPSGKSYHVCPSSHSKDFGKTISSIEDQATIERYLLTMPYLQTPAQTHFQKIVMMMT